MFYTLGLLFT